MSAARFPRLLRAELRLILGERLTWAILAALVTAFFLAAWTGAERVAADRAALASAAADTERAVREAKDAHRRYGQPAAITVNYWQDPTDAFGYMTYFMAAYAVKPPTPLAMLAAGQSDVQPTVMKVSFGFSTVFDDTTTEIGSAGALRLGSFDLAFVLALLVPLAIIALAGTRLSSEHDNGILRMIAAQPVSPGLVAGAKFAAAALVAGTAVIGGTVFALLFSGGLGSLDGWSWTAALLVAALTAYVVFWIAACALAASLWRGAVAALAGLVLAWACLTVALPTALGFAVEALAPVPSRIAAIDASRHAQARFYAGQEASRITAAWLATKLSEDARRPELADAPEVKRLARDAHYDEALADHHRAAREQAHAASAWSRRLALLSPATALTLALETASGSDAGRHAAFLVEAAAYWRSLRAFFEPRILAQAVSPAPVCTGCPARLSFSAYDAVPTFEATDPRAAALRQALVSLVCLVAGTLLLAGLAARRLKAWPMR